MKFSRPFLFVIFYLVIVPQFAISQTAARALNSTNAGEWKPVKIQSDGGNVYKGVEFFRKKEGCNSEDIVFIKLVNRNNYPVEVKWTSDDGLKSTVMVNGGAEIEGSCSVYLQNQKNNLSALTIPKSVIQKEKSLKQKILANLEVVEIKK